MADRGSFVPTHRLTIIFDGQEVQLFVRLVTDRAGFGPAWTKSAWDLGADQDFVRTASRWMYLGQDPRFGRIEAARKIEPYTYRQLRAG